MTTYDDLVNEIIDQLQGFTAAPDQVTSLTTALTASDLSFTVADPGSLSRGFVEIDDEMLWVDAVDPTGPVTVPAFGRGYKGTTAAPHASGAKVTYRPTWTRASVRREINTQISALYPILYGVWPAPVFTMPGGFTYQFNLPSNAERVVDVRFKHTSAGGWRRARSWEAEHSAPSEFLGGRFISIRDDVPSGSQVQVLYAARPSALVNGDDDFAVVTGLAEGVKDVVTLGVQARLARFLDAARLSSRDVQADQLDQPRGMGTAAGVANDLFRQYQVRLASEQKALSDRYPPRYHRTT